jgi:hypothetical protein
MRSAAFAIVAVVASSVAAQTVTLQSVIVSGSQATVTYSKDFATCAHLKLLDGTLVHAANFFCTSGTNVAISVPLSGFNAGFQLGVQVMLCHGNNGSICSAPVTVIVDPALVGAPPTVSLAAGGVHQLSVGASALAAGGFYLIAGTVSGTSPGFPVGQFLVPLNPDDWFNVTVSNPDTFPLSGFQGLLDAAGNAVATLTVPAGLPPSLAGLVINHAVGVVTPGGVLVGVSAAASLTLTP